MPYQATNRNTGLSERKEIIEPTIARMKRKASPAPQPCLSVGRDSNATDTHASPAPRRGAGTIAPRNSRDPSATVERAAPKLLMPVLPRRRLLNASRASEDGIR